MSPPSGGGGSGTRSGHTFEQIVVPALERNDYKVSSQKLAGLGLGGGRQRSDKAVIAPNGDEIVISLKWQGGNGTVDEKIPYEVIKLLYYMEQFPHKKRAYIVLAGDGCRPHLLKFYRDGGLTKWVPDAAKVKCLTLNEFLHACNKKTL